MRREINAIKWRRTSSSLIARQVERLQSGQRERRRRHRVDHVVREVERLERGEPREDEGVHDVQVVRAQVRVLQLVQWRVLLRALGARDGGLGDRHLGSVERSFDFRICQNFRSDKYNVDDSRSFTITDCDYEFSDLV